MEVQPRAVPPVCRFQNFGKAQYAAKLREKVFPVSGALYEGIGYCVCIQSWHQEGSIEWVITRWEVAVKE